MPGQMTLLESLCRLTTPSKYDGSICQEGGFYCPDSASSLYYKGSASLNGTINLSVCA